ncbi:MAG: phenylalanine--tRNA ligase subunit beta [Synechococcus sp. MED-G67]|nr:MAG: phenylalanine--tRNA ligase subunit beta [Synechococcus sp. MED-G67]|tara:strand:- start:1235 stop:3679 length:2445 start_codon:yes stop_codon:yes gene_type:complete
MRVSLQWLRDLVPFRSDVDSLAEQLSMAGFEVEEQEDLAARAAGVVVGQVLSKTPHPDANKLNVCSVSIGGGSEPLQIVCGAANVREGMAVAVATVGSHLPAVDLTIKPAKLRGVDSCGMLCSLSELGLETNSEGLVDLEVVAGEQGSPLPQLGEPVGPLLGLTDHILELAITANRPDGMSMLGIAREVAALEDLSVQEPPSAELEPAVQLETAPFGDHALLFSLTALEGISNGPSPKWLRQRLEAAGQRSINTVVDITNLVMLETGQPLHAYDRDRLADLGPEGFGLRAASSDESIELLDGQTLKLRADNLLVSHGGQAVALAGVMGGQSSAVTESTQRIWLEAAVFPQNLVRRSSRVAGLRTESSARFERGVPQALTLEASNRAVALLQELCQAKVTGRWQASPVASATEPLVLRREALDRLLGPLGSGEWIEDSKVGALLERLGCSLQSHHDDDDQISHWSVQVPPSRQLDLQREVDLIEEIARLVGYDNFGSHLPDPVEPGGLTAEQELLRRLRSNLRAAGLQEISHLSLVASEEPSNPAQVAISNPLLTDYGCLRTTVVPALLEAAARNLQASQAGFWGFEIGKVFARDGDVFSEEERLCGVLAGERRQGLWSTSGQPSPLSYHQGRGLLARAMAQLGLSLQDRRLEDDERLHPGRSATLVLEGKVIGVFGELHPRLAEQQDLPAGTLIFDLALQPVLTAASRTNRYCPAFKSFATVPASERDLAFVVEDTQDVASVLQTIRKAGGQLLEHVDLLDRYSGSPIPEGSCSLAVRLRFRDPKATLRDEQVDPLLNKVRQSLEKSFKAELRC